MRNFLFSVGATNHRTINAFATIRPAKMHRDLSAPEQLSTPHNSSNISAPAATLHRPFADTPPSYKTPFFLQESSV